MPLLAAFRDPAGSLEIRSDGAYRFVRAPYDAECRLSWICRLRET